MKRYAVTTVAAALALGACTSEPVDPSAYLGTVRANIQPTRPLTDAALVGYAKDICADVSDPGSYIDASAATYPGIGFGDGPALVDAAILDYCPEVGDDVLDENGDFRM